MKAFLYQCFDFPSHQFVYLPLTWSGVPEQYFDLPPPLRSQGDLVTQPSQSKLDATIRCWFVAAFFNCPSITRPATEFYRDLKEKDAVISSVPKMRKNEDVSITRGHRHNMHSLTRSAHKTIYVRAMAPKIETPIRDKI